MTNKPSKTTHDHMPEHKEMSYAIHGTKGAKIAIRFCRCYCDVILEVNGRKHSIEVEEADVRTLAALIPEGLKMMGDHQ